MVKKILVVEDNDFVRMQICKFLHESGYEIVEASDGKEALDIVKSQEISMAVVDVRMEPMNGFEFIKSVSNEDMQLPAILVTGDNDPDLLSDASRLGVTAMLRKPIQKERLIKLVERILPLEKAKQGC